MKTPKQIKHALAKNWEDAYVEEKIRDLVRVFNRKSLGIRTIAACEGHFKYPNSPYLFFQCPVHIAEMIEKRIVLALVRKEGLNTHWKLNGGFNQHFKLGFTLRSFDLSNITEKNSFLQRFWTYKIKRQKIDDDLALLAKIIEDLLNDFETTKGFEVPDPYDKKNYASKQGNAPISPVQLFLLTKWIYVRTLWTRIINFSLFRKLCSAFNTRLHSHNRSPKNTPKNRLSAKFTILLLVVSLLFWFGFSQLANATEWTFGKAQVKTVKSIYDGDTFRVDVAGWPSIIGTNIPIRVAGVDTPEIKGKCRSEIDLATQARDFAAQMLRSGQPILLTNIRRGKYFRIVADVWIGEHNLAQVLIKKGLGRAYNGRKRKGWCS